MGKCEQRGDRLAAPLFHVYITALLMNIYSAPQSNLQS